MLMWEIHIYYIHYLYMSHSHCSFIPRNVKEIKWIIIGWTFTGKLDTILNISNTVLLTMQEKWILSKSHGTCKLKMSVRLSCQEIKGYIK